MKIEQITVTDDNMLELMRSKDVYVIKERGYDDEFRMYAIGECEVKDLISGTVAVIRITKE